MQAPLLWWKEYVLLSRRDFRCRATDFRCSAAGYLRRVPRWTCLRRLVCAFLESPVRLFIADMLFKYNGGI